MLKPARPAGAKLDAVTVVEGDSVTGVSKPVRTGEGVCCREFAAKSESSVKLPSALSGVAVPSLAASGDIAVMLGRQRQVFRREVFEEVSWDDGASAIRQYQQCEPL